MPEDLLLLPLAAFLAFLFGWNNSSLLIGNARGSGTLTTNQAIIISTVGLVLGVLLEGSKMVKSLDGSLSSGVTAHSIVITLLVTIALVLALTLRGLPASFSMVLVAAFLGSAFASHLPLDASRLTYILAFWVVAPVATGGITFVIYRLFSTITPRFSLLSVDSFNRLGVVLSSIAVAYVLAANNIGLIYGATVMGPSPHTELLQVVVLLLIAVAGMTIMGRGAVSGTVGDRLIALSPQGVLAVFLSSALVMWFGTQFGLPISITQCLIGGMFGAAFTKRITVVNRRLTAETFISWVVVPLAAFGLSFVLSPLV